MMGTDLPGDETVPRPGGCPGGVPGAPTYPVMKKCHARVGAQVTSPRAPTYPVMKKCRARVGARVVSPGDDLPGDDLPGDEKSIASRDARLTSLRGDTPPGILPFIPRLP